LEKKRRQGGILIANCGSDGYAIALSLCGAYIQDLRKGRVDPMTGHRPFKELTKGFSDARQAHVVERHSELKSEMALHQLLQARERSQEGLARETPPAHKSR
jgi:hypothetical protein